ncbi:hypothetical protein FCV25MIE_07464, partial [Fagus crenata]
PNKYHRCGFRFTLTFFSQGPNVPYRRHHVPIEKVAVPVILKRLGPLHSWIWAVSEVTVEECDGILGSVEDVFREGRSWSGRGGEDEDLRLREVSKFCWC